MPQHWAQQAQDHYLWSKGTCSTTDYESLTVKWKQRTITKRVHCRGSTKYHSYEASFHDNETYIAFCNEFWPIEIPIQQVGPVTTSAPATGVMASNYFGYCSTS